MKKILLISSIFIVPQILFAATSFNNFADLVYSVIDTILKPVIGLIGIYSLVYLIYNAFLLVKSMDSKDRSSYAKRVMWGLLAFALMFSFWGVISIFNGIFGINNSDPINISSGNTSGFGVTTGAVTNTTSGSGNGGIVGGVGGVDTTGSGQTTSSGCSLLGLDFSGACNWWDDAFGVPYRNIRDGTTVN